ncbi:DUF6520 family protein [Mariniflexile sp. HNIBRBA6329]|uniref:DUF6520 family protein n=1 Tax=Mariniflexile sp. HNIBRBA6329 TaxID=3373088 RepID=UPI003746E198
MKTKVFKFVLPVFAILMAISLSFAVEANKTNQTGYYDHPTFGATPVTVDCDAPSGPQCLFGQYPVYEDEGLLIPLYKNIP